VQAALAGRRGGVAPTGSGLGGSFTGAPDGVADDGKLGDYGLAPALVAQGPWFNTGAQSAGQKTIPTPSPALLPAELRGKVILVDFWTYSCVNCVRTLPYLRAWYETYKDRGFVIIGVHSPEFEFEKVSANVARAMRDLGVSWPVVQDNDYAQWNAYGNKYWPAHYFIDAKGQVRYFHFGEGGYDIAEGVIKALLKEAGAPVGAAAGGAAASGAATTSTSVATAAGPVLEAQTPETYLGYERGRGLRSAITPVADKAAVYTLASGLANGEWSLQGGWTVTGQYIRPEGSGSLEIDFHSKDLFLVVEPEDGYGSLVVSLDGKPGPDTADVKGGVVKPQASRLYHLVALPKGGEHLLRLDVRGKLRLFAFTFG
jgi:thiol-disulfide isomerase/thioredoxin